MDDGRFEGEALTREIAEPVRNGILEIMMR